MNRLEFEAIKLAINKIKEERDDLLTSWNDIDAVKYRLDELGKIQQTTEGTGDPFDPIKYWHIGMKVTEGLWYQCFDENGYIWEAIKTGIPSSDIDSEYFDVVGI